jgi:serine/threonine-protein kinase RsbW
VAADKEDFVLELPAAPEYLSMARLFVVALARHFGSGEEAVEDARRAVSEACTSAIRWKGAAGGHDPVTVRAARCDGRLRFEIEDVGPEDATKNGALGDGSGVEGGPQLLGLRLLGVLTDDGEIGPSPSGGTRVVFSIATEKFPPVS